MTVPRDGQEKDRRGLLYLEQAQEISCTRYEPCPICFKCMRKASHLFVKCGNCPIPICGHQEKARDYMIRRENFRDKFMQFMPGVDEKFEKYQKAKEVKADDN